MRAPRVPLSRTAPVLMGAPTAQSGGGASESQCVVALVKNIVGTGVLTLPAGVSRLSDNGMASSDALAVALALGILIGVLNTYGFVLVGEACSATGEASYVGAWRKTLGAQAAFLPALASLLLCFTAGVSCATVIADTFTDLLTGAFALGDGELSRNAVLAVTSATVLFPLCLLPSLAPLGTASLLGVGGVFVTSGAMLARYADGSYAPGGELAELATWVPTFHIDAAPPSAAALPSVGSVCFFVSLLSSAFVAHYNAPAVYSELAAAPAASNGGATPSATEAAAAQASRLSFLGRLRLAQRAEAVNDNFRSFIEATRLGLSRRAAATPRMPSDSGLRIADGVLEDELAARQLTSFRRVAAQAFGISALLFALIAGAGFATFGDASQALILANYAASDPCGAVARAGVALCVLFEFPLLERPFRLTTLQLLGLEASPGTPEWTASACASCLLLCGIAALGVQLDLISAVSGSTGGALLIYIAPALMTLRLDASDAKGTGGSTGRALPLWILAALGVALGAIGTIEELEQLV